MPRVNSHRRRVGEHEVVKPPARRLLPTRVARAKAALRPRSLRGSACGRGQPHSDPRCVRAAVSPDLPKPRAATAPGQPFAERSGMRRVIYSQVPACPTSQSGRPTASPALVTPRASGPWAVVSPVCAGSRQPVRRVALGCVRRSSAIGGAPPTHLDVHSGRENAHRMRQPTPIHADFQRRVSHLRGHSGIENPHGDAFRGAALCTGDEQLAAAAVVHGHIMEPGASAQLSKLLVGVEVAAACDRFRGCGRSA